MTAVTKVGKYRDMAFPAEVRYVLVKRTTDEPALRRHGQGGISRITAVTVFAGNIVLRMPARLPGLGDGLPQYASGPGWGLLYFHVLRGAGHF